MEVGVWPGQLVSALAQNTQFLSIPGSLACGASPPRAGRALERGSQVRAPRLHSGFIAPSPSREPSCFH